MGRQRIRRYGAEPARLVVLHCLDHFRFRVHDERSVLVERTECHDDGRGAWVVLTQHGRAAIESAAPGHAATVRRLIFDSLTPDEIAVMSSVIDKVLSRLPVGQTTRSAPT